MITYKKIETSAEVYYAIIDRHSEDMRVFERNTELFDEKNPGRGSTTMSFSLKGFTYPIIGKTSSWEIPKEGERHDFDKDKVEYWLCLPLEEK